jgi:hypothetical protein
MFAMAAFVVTLLTAFVAQASPAPAPVASLAPAPKASPAPAPEPMEGTPAPAEGSPAPSVAVPPPPGVQFQPPLENGACLDSIRAVPNVLQGPSSRGMQIVRIDQVVSTATMLPGEIIGFLYTTQDGGTWLGQRTRDYQSAADATAINRVLAAARVAGSDVGEFPPTSLYGVPTKHQQIFRVQMPAGEYSTLRIALVPCVIWPSDRQLPDPPM